jgi:hypothetical protein
MMQSLSNWVILLVPDGVPMIQSPVASNQKAVNVRATAMHRLNHTSRWPCCNQGRIQLLITFLQGQQGCRLGDAETCLLPIKGAKCATQDNNQQPQNNRARCT